MEMEPIIASDNQETALVVHGDDAEGEQEESEEESSSEEEREEDYPPGPVDPDKCSVGGPGTTGGSAQAPVSFYIHAKDSRDKRVAEGGDYVVVRVIPGSTAKAAGAREAEAIVKDNGDGSYTATYSVEARGDYELTVEINGSAIGGSPFPVFFSPPEERPAGESVITDAAGAPIDASTLSAAADVPMPVISILGSSAYAAKVEFPQEQEALERTVIVGSMNPQVTLEQLRQLFSYSGKVSDCNFTGESNQFAFIEFATPKEAEQALTLDKLSVIDRQIRVEPAKTAFESKGQSGGVQFAALQLQQIQQLQKAQMEQHSLAAQVAQMRVQAKQNPGAFAPGLPQNSASQKAAALSAIAALSKRLTGSSHGAAAPAAPAAPAPSGGTKRRREVSPTLRYRSEKRSPPRRRLSPVRRRSPPRRRSPERRRSPQRRGSRDHRRGGSTDRHRRSRSRSRPRREARDRGGSRSRRDSSRERRHRKERSRSIQPTRRTSKEAEARRSPAEDEGTPELRSGRKEAPDSIERIKEAAHAEQADAKAEDEHQNTTDGEHRRRHKESRSDRDRSNHRSERRHRSEKHHKRENDRGTPGPTADENGHSTEDVKAVEAQELREKALEALKSMPLATQETSTGGAEAGATRQIDDRPSGSIDNGEDRREHRSKRHKKEKRHKKDKRHREAVKDLSGDHELPEIEPDE